MGSILSAIRDDEEDYEHLCKKYGEKIDYDGVYSVHHKWLEARNENKTTLSLEEYRKQTQIKNLKSSIEYQQKRVDDLKNQLKDLEK